MQKDEEDVGYHSLGWSVPALQCTTLFTLGNQTDKILASSRIHVSKPV